MLRHIGAGKASARGKQQLFLMRVLRQPLDARAARVEIKVDDEDGADRLGATRVVEGDSRALGCRHEGALDAARKLALLTAEKLGWQLPLILPNAAIDARRLRAKRELQHT